VEVLGVHRACRSRLTSNKERLGKAAWRRYTILPLPLVEDLKAAKMSWLIQAALVASKVTFHLSANSGELAKNDRGLAMSQALF
jgi:hypothetical protein